METPVAIKDNVRNSSHCVSDCHLIHCVEVAFTDSRSRVTTELWLKWKVQLCFIESDV